MKSKLKVWFICLLVLAVIAGCSNNSNSGNSENSGNGGAENNSTQQTQNDGSDQNTAKKDLVYAQSIAITSLETAGMQPQGYPAGYEAAFAIYNGLVKFDENLNFQPDLATDWKIEDDQLTWTFYLREGVKFHDGTDFNADAVVNVYSKMLDSSYNVGAYSLWSPIDKVVKVDDYTVQIVTKEPYGGLLNILAHGSALIPSPKALEEYGDNYSLNPVGTGPYMVEKFDPGTELVLKANENYFNGKPKYDTITFRYVADDSARIAALRSGQADVIDAVPEELAQGLANEPTLKVIDKPGLQVFGLGLNQTNEILQDKNVRQALNYAIDKESIVSALFSGFGTPLTSPLAPNTTGYVEAGYYEYNVDQAKQLLAEAGWQPGSDGVLVKNGQRLSLKLRTPEGSYPNDVLIAEAVQSQLKEIGVEVTIEKVESATFWDGLKVPKNKVDFDMVLFGYNPSHGDGYIQMDAMYATNPSEAEAPIQWNFNWYSNPEVDRLLAEARRTVDIEQRTQILGEAQKMVWDDAVYLWLFAKNILTAHRADVEGVQVLPVVFTLVHGDK